VVLAEGGVDHALEQDHFGLADLGDERGGLEELLGLDALDEHFVARVAADDVHTLERVVRLAHRHLVAVRELELIVCASEGERAEVDLHHAELVDAQERIAAVQLAWMQLVPQPVDVDEHTVEFALHEQHAQVH